MSSTPVTDPRRICRQLVAGRSEHDVLGELTGAVGNAARAQHLLDMAREAYCRDR